MILISPAISVAIFKLTPDLFLFVWKGYNRETAENSSLFGDDGGSEWKLSWVGLKNNFTDQVYKL